jgi:[acyl-carrier-protein] S-malonyltransferase
MQKACESNPGTMAAVINLSEEKISEVCASCDGVVVPANYNSKRQIVISGEVSAVEQACVKMKEAGARRALVLPVGGAFHSPLMESARQELADCIEHTDFKTPACPIYQNVTAQPTADPVLIKENLLKQLTSPVRWTHTVQNMISDGASEFIEVGPGAVLQGLVGQISSEVITSGAQC